MACFNQARTGIKERKGNATDIRSLSSDALESLDADAQSGLGTSLVRTFDPGITIQGLRASSRCSGPSRRIDSPMDPFCTSDIEAIGLLRLSRPYRPYRPHRPHRPQRRVRRARRRDREWKWELRDASLANQQYRSLAQCTVVFV
jgi:hypothetical protein